MVDGTLYTAWFDQGGGKGEARTVAVLVAYAESEEQMRNAFRERHGFEPGQISIGIVENEYTEFALSKPILSEAKLARLLGAHVNIEVGVYVRLKPPERESEAVDTAHASTPDGLHVIGGRKRRG